MVTRNHILVTIFLIFLSLPWLQKLSDAVKVEPVNEKREKKEMPKMGFLGGPAKDRDYAAKVEAFFSDHFPLRDLLLRAHGQLEYAVFNRAREVVVGKQGWLSDKKLISEHLPALDRLDSNQLRAGVLRLKQLQSAMAERGVFFLVVVVPLKPSVYPEMFDQDRSESGSTGLEIFQEALSKNGIPYVDLLGELRRRKGSRPFYYKTDMHWNSKGVSVGAELIVNRLSTHFIDRAIWNPKPNISNKSFIGEELRSIPLFTIRPEVAPVWSDDTASLHRNSNGKDLETFTSKDSRAVLPPTLMFGNSFMLQYPAVGYHAYFKESSRVLDYKNFKKALDYIKPFHKAVILHIYETQLLYHIMPTGKAGVWSGFASYWDERLDQVLLPAGFNYVAPAGLKH